MYVHEMVMLIWYNEKIAILTSVCRVDPMVVLSMTTKSSKYIKNKIKQAIHNKKKQKSIANSTIRR